ncbi:serine/threonine-protein kinase [uncultured Corynebacterium sp.]|uniref:serine/threonine-protein kinase n=1 Tax=uncultured Corynebacterium sp. TaxID=159447 RepID=UPI0025ECD046|nr:serine/threonine-protein kinase [uncultured Corynebacterium sp.]
MNEHRDGDGHRDGSGSGLSGAPAPGDDGWTRFLSFLGERHGLTDLSQIGKGGMGRVYRARDRELNRWVAVKVLESAGATPDGLQRFRQESRILGQLRHPAIVGVHSARISPDGVAYFVMDYVDGGDLGSLIASRRTSGGPFTVAETVGLLRPVADALDTIHDMRPQVIHRDVKPANILVPGGAHRHSAWNASVLTDFGISLTQDDTRLTSVGFLIGTDRYMAPEQFRSVQGGPVPGASVDLYAFALIVFEMLTLRPLRETMPEAAWRFARQFPSVPARALAGPDQGRAPAILTVLARALADDPSQRYVSAHEILSALEATTAAPAGPAPTAQTAPTVQDAPGAQGRRSDRPQRPRRSRRRVLVTVSAVAAVVVLALGGVAVADHARHPGWSDAEQSMVAAFPDLLPDRQDESGWLGMTCSSASAGDGERARITCHGGGRTLVVADFGDAETRDRLGSSAATRVLTSGDCVIEVGPVGDAQVALPQAGDRDRYSLLLASDTAEDDLRGVPVCS